MQFKEKVVLVTGASSGIGSGIAVYFANHGASVVMNGRNEEGLDETIETCTQTAQAQDFKIVKVVGDVNDETVLQNMVDTAIKNFGKIDVLVNNAGAMLEMTGLEGLNLKNYDETMNTNLRSAMVLIKLCLPHLEKTKGNIVNISSIAGTIGGGGGKLAYAISKAGMNMLTVNSCVELAPKGIRINAVCPGAIVTPIRKQAGMSDEEVEKQREKAKIKYPVGREGTVEEVADLVGFLASESAGFITGETLHIDGGRHAVVPT